MTLPASTQPSIEPAVDAARQPRSAMAPIGPRFAGRFAGKLDAKGRVIIPPVFRQRLAGELYLFPSLVEPVIQLGDATLPDLILDAVAALEMVDDMDERLTKLENYVLEKAQPVAMDDAGRVVLPADLRQHARLEGPLTFGGRESHMVLAPVPYFTQLDQDAQGLAADMQTILAAKLRPRTQARRTR